LAKGKVIGRIFPLLLPNLGEGIGKENHLIGWLEWFPYGFRRKFTLFKTLIFPRV